MGWFSSKLPKLREITEAAEKRSLPQLIESLERAGSERALLARALRVDLATIAASPEMAFRCMWNRASWLPSLRQHLEAWAEQHDAAWPWARALRPPRFGLEGPLREEYRADYGGGGSLVLDSKHVVSGRVSWDRRLALRLAEPVGPLEPNASDGWRLDHPTPHWGRCRIVASDGNAVVLDVRVNADDSYTSFAATPDGRSIVSGGWFEDYAGTVCLFDAKPGKLRWRAELNREVSSVAISGNGSTVVAFSGGHATVLDAGSGTERGRLFVDAGHGALDHGGRELVTQSRRVLRVWDLTAPRGSEGDGSGAGQGWVSAAFSPDGRRLLTGQLLCDARTGALISRLQTDGPGYLEGGPPFEGRVLANDRFVELSPFAGITIWDTATGERAAAPAEKRRFSLEHEVRFSRDGRYLVYRGQRERNELRVLRVDDGQQVSQLGLEDVTAFEVDPTRPRLATAHQDGWFRIWQLPDLALLHEWGESFESEVGALTYSLDGARLVARSETGLLRQWNLRDGSRLGQRHDSQRPTPLTLHGWLGFVGRSHPYRTRWDGGFLLLEHEQGRHHPLAIPSDQELEIDGSGTRAAFRYEHFALER